MNNAQLLCLTAPRIGARLFWYEQVLPFLITRFLILSQPEEKLAYHSKSGQLPDFDDEKMNRWNIKIMILFQFWIYMSFFFLLTGQNISEFEKVLRTIRDLWYSPDNNSNVGDIQYLHNYYKFIQRYVQCSLFNFMWNYFFFISLWIYCWLFEWNEFNW